MEKFSVGLISSLVENLDMDRNAQDSAGCIVFSSNKVLVIHYYSKYGFPKGHLEEGETLLQTAVRETEEETGIVVRILSPNPYSVRSAKPGDTRFVHYFVAEWKSGIPTPQKGEVDEVLWLTPEETLEKLSFPQDRAVLSEILASRSIFQ